MKEHEADIIANKEFTREVPITKQRKVDLNPGQCTTNCLTCNVTCHLDCRIPENANKYNCWAMEECGSKDTTCRQCPKKCIWNAHVNNPYIFELYQEMETITLYKLKAVHDTATINKEKIESVMEKMDGEVEEMGQAVLQNIKQVRQSLQRLQEIALRPDPLTEVEYIDILIESERLEVRPGWIKRVKTLQEVRKKAELLSTVPDAAESLQNDPEHEGKSIWNFWRCDWRKK